MRTCIAVFFLVSLLVAGTLSAQAAKEIKKVPLSPTSPVSGVEMFRTYCAVCHGVNGKGAGPAAEALKKAPTDLTQLAVRNNGKYPEDRVAHAITGDAQIGAHGSHDMPVWGDLFKSLNSGTSDLVRLRIVNLTDYVKSIQAK
jgi:mono/diheme cytochrome c family protein